MFKNIFFKKYFSFFLIAIFIVSQFNNIAFAQTSPFPASLGSGCSAAKGGIKAGRTTVNCIDPSTGNNVSYTCTADPVNKTYTSCDKMPTPDARAAESSGPLAFIFSSFIWLVSWIVVNVILTPINFVLNMVMKIASVAFDFTVYFTILKFKQNFGDLKLDISGGYFPGTASVGASVVGESGSNLIYYLWGMIRDFLNIIIFFVIIYHAVRSMFDGFADTRNKFIYLLVFSILVNFSLLFVKVAIDVSNIFALQAYTLAVKPSGTSNFREFGTSSSGPASYGEYIVDKIGLGTIFSNATPNPAVKDEVEKLKDTFIFNIGLVLVYIGIIYVLLYMTMLLLNRAVIFLYSMILAPILALQIYFEMFKGNSRLDDFREQINNITTRIKDDFYGALIRGPLIIFSVFLVGVFANLIFNDSLGNQFSSSVVNVDGLKDFPKDFALNIFVFFKFALFFALCRFMLQKIEEIKFGKHMSSIATKMTNFAFGRGMGGLAGAGGFIGRNYIGRNLANPNSTLGRALTSLNNQGLKWANADSKTILGGIQRTIGRAGLASIKGLKTGSYDAGNLAKGINAATGGKLGSTIEKLVGKVDFGKRAEGGFDVYDAKAKAKREAVRDKELKAAHEGYVATEADITNASHKVAIKEFGGGSLFRFEEALKGKIKDTTTEEEAFLNRYKNNDADILAKIEEAREKRDKVVDGLVEDHNHHEEEHILKEYEKGKRSGSFVVERIADKIANRSTSVLAPESRPEDMERRLRANSSRLSQKQAKEKQIQIEKTHNIISRDILNSTSSVENLYTQTLSKLSEDEKIILSTSVKKQLETLEKFKKISETLRDTRGKDDDALKKQYNQALKDYDGIHNELFSSKDFILARISEFNIGKRYDDKVTTKIKTLERMLNQNKKTYEDNKPKKTDSHGPGADKDKKGATGAKPEGKKEEKHG